MEEKQPKLPEHTFHLYRRWDWLSAFSLSAGRGYACKQKTPRRVKSTLKQNYQENTNVLDISTKFNYILLRKEIPKQLLSDKMIQKTVLTQAVSVQSYFPSVLLTVGWWWSLGSWTHSKVHCVFSRQLADSVTCQSAKQKLCAVTLGCCQAQKV